MRTGPKLCGQHLGQSPGTCGRRRRRRKGKRGQPRPSGARAGSRGRRGQGRALPTWAVAGSQAPSTETLQHMRAFLQEKPENPHGFHFVEPSRCSEKGPAPQRPALSGGAPGAPLGPKLPGPSPRPRRARAPGEDEEGDEEGDEGGARRHFSGLLRRGRAGCAGKGVGLAGRTSSPRNASGRLPALPPAGTAPAGTPPSPPALPCSLPKSPGTRPGTGGAPRPCRQRGCAGSPRAGLGQRRAGAPRSAPSTGPAPWLGRAQDTPPGFGHH